ncbi:ribonuclease HII [Patescibacteria group bacterium]|nr:ribonuclease HII [Patescibacteria group bacterium]
MIYPNRQLENKLAKKYKLIAGVDEAGRGALAGPIAAAAVILPKKKITGIKDSKLLSPAKRAQLFCQIKKEAIAWAVATIPNSQIDQIGINPANKLVMEKAIAKLKTKPNYVLIDGNLPIKTNIPNQLVIGGDRKIYSIAAASILAKVHRDKLLISYDRKYPGYGLAQHKGYGTKLHLTKIKKLKSCRLHRQSFLTHL